MGLGGAGGEARREKDEKMSENSRFWKADGLVKALARRASGACVIAAVYSVAVFWMDSKEELGGTPILLIGLEALLGGILSVLAGVVAEWRKWDRGRRWGLQAVLLGVCGARVVMAFGECLDEYGLVSRLALVLAALALTGLALGVRAGQATEGGPRLAVGLAVGGAAALGLMLGGGAVAGVTESLFHVSSHIWDGVERLALGPAAALGTLTAMAWATAERPFELPVAWRALLKWVAMPVHAVFTGVLLAYFAWCVARWDLPNGQIALFATMAGLGWVALQLLGAGEKGALRWYARWGGLAVLPLTALQFVALGIRVGQYGLTPVRCGGYAVAVFVAVYALAAALRPAFWARWGWAWIALVLFVAGASPWNAVDLGVGAQFRRLEAFRTRREAGEVFDGPARAAIMGTWDATDGFARRGGHFRRKVSMFSWRYPVAGDFKEEWGFYWVEPWYRNQAEKEEITQRSHTFSYAVKANARMSCPPAASVMFCTLHSKDGRIVIRTWDGHAEEYLEATDAVMRAWDENGTAVDLHIAELGDGRWLLLGSAHVSFIEQTDGCRKYTEVYGGGWLFSERGDDEE